MLQSTLWDTGLNSCRSLAPVQIDAIYSNQAVKISEKIKGVYWYYSFQISYSGIYFFLHFRILVPLVVGFD